jgi:thiamine pyrophosphokinase
MIIFANGNISGVDINKLDNTTMIAADGGAHHCIKLGIIPHIVIGDFDSLNPETLILLKKSGANLIRYPSNKDQTDLELALNYAIANGATNITLYGLLGGRWDMSIANILLLSSPNYRHIKFHIIDEATEMFILRGENTLELNGKKGDTVSVIPLSNTTSGITYSGLEWPLEHASLDFGSPRGVSNRMLSELAHIHLDTGVLFVILIHH